MSVAQTLPADADSLSAPPPVFSEDAAVALAKRHFSIDGAASKLTSERDANFRIKTAAGDSYVLKVSNPAEEKLVTNLQTEALLHVAVKDPDLPVQRVLPNVAGTHEEILQDAAGQPLILRLFTYLEGEPLHLAPRSAAQRRNLGSNLARLTFALSDFTHAATDHDLQWDIKHASRLWQLLPHIEAGERRQLVERILRNFDDFVAPSIPRLRTQFVHNDLNPHNVLVDSVDPTKVAGILDFGDMVFTPLVNDLAVASAYQLSLDGDPLVEASDLIGAYHGVLPLQEIEVELLYDLIGARLATTAAITSWRAARYPENSAYILRNAPRAWAGLAAFAALPRAKAQENLRRLCGI
nr:phosphotransferase [uncultured Dongia sp.]